MQKGHEKVSQYNWAKPGDSGEFRLVQVADLKIDHSYQRQEVSEANSLAIAGKLNWTAFGVLLVMERANGDLYLIDGQQRLAAVKRREDISAVPCIVFKSDGREHEAQAFVSVNINRKQVTAFDKFRALAKAGIEPVKTINNWLISQELHIREDGKTCNAIDFPATLMTSWDGDAEASKKAIILQRNIIGPSPMNGYLHKGLWYLEHNRIDVSSHVEKLQKLGGLPAILRAINTYGIETGNEARSIRVCGFGILALINYRRKIKIRISEE